LIMLALVQRAADTLREGGLTVGFLGVKVEPSAPAGWRPAPSLVSRFGAGKPVEPAGPPRVATARCPCCGYRTLSARGLNETCPICDWLDDGQDDVDADVIRHGMNGPISLTVARNAYRSMGAVRASALERVRKPRPNEV
jgi:hypothetical protein